MILEEEMTDTINMTVIEKSICHLKNQFMDMLMGISLVSGGRLNITYDTLYKGWSMLCCSLLDTTQQASDQERDSDMEANKRIR